MYMHPCVHEYMYLYMYMFNLLCNSRGKKIWIYQNVSTYICFSFNTQTYPCICACTNTAHPIWNVVVVKVQAISLSLKRGKRDLWRWTLSLREEGEKSETPLQTKKVRLHGNHENMRLNCLYLWYICVTCLIYINITCVFEYTFYIVESSVNTNPEILII